VQRRESYQPLERRKVYEQVAEQLLAEIANLGEEVGAKTPDDYGLPKLADLPASYR